MELDAPTLALVNPSTQPETMDATPTTPPRLLQPSSSELTLNGTNLLHTLEDLTPQGTHRATAQYKTAAATPVGEDAEARDKRLAAERARRHRARERVQADLEKQVAAEKAALAAHRRRMRRQRWRDWQL